MSVWPSVHACLSTKYVLDLQRIPKNAVQHQPQCYSLHSCGRRMSCSGLFNYRIFSFLTAPHGHAHCTVVAVDENKFDSNTFVTAMVDITTVTSVKCECSLYDKIDNRTTAYYELSSSSVTDASQSNIWRLLQINYLHCPRSFVQAIAPLSVKASATVSSFMLFIQRRLGLTFFYLLWILHVVICVKCCQITYM